ncbi:MAG TPA: hypothetical protein VED00_00405 [archaeon]|nr:hypothetical protein [archaeon]
MKFSVIDAAICLAIFFLLISYIMPWNFSVPSLWYSLILISILLSIFALLISHVKIYSKKAESLNSILLLVSGGLSVIPTMIENQNPSNLVNVGIGYQICGWAAILLIFLGVLEGFKLVGMGD